MPNPSSTLGLGPKKDYMYMYEDLVFQGKGSKGTKRRRSGGQMMSAGAV